MRSFSESNPAAQLAFFLAEIVTVMFCGDPVMYVISLAGGLAFFLALDRLRSRKMHLFFLISFAVMSLINPLVTHRGETVLFVMNDSPVTLEALIYGISSACMVISVMYWSACFSRVMTGDRLLYVSGVLSPKLSLVLSMALRYIPLFVRYAKKVDDAQKTLGLYKNDNVIDSLRAKTRVFSAMTTWALENGIITAESMEARGYGTGKRTFFSNYRFTPWDTALTALSAALAAGIAAGTALGAAGYDFYPSVKSPENSGLSAAVYTLYGVLSFLPVLIETAEGAKWRYLRSKI